MSTDVLVSKVKVIGQAGGEVTKRLRLNKRKFKELTLYLAEESMGDPHFGATKLNKQLFFADFLAYAYLGKPITGATYRKLPYGAAAKQLPELQQELEEEGAAVVITRTRYQYQQTRLIPQRDPDLSHFSADEMALVDKVIRGLLPYNAVGVSDLSHEKILGWQLAQDHEEIPYEAIFLSVESPTQVDIGRALELAEKHGWLS